MSIDSIQRQRALDPQTSFIVQAPAGSGKTELLVQRFLVLLGQVEQPEEIIALTFTRKAAMEMRERVIHALTHSLESEPSSAHARQTWQLAKKALAKDQQFNWGLLDNPHRLRIQTIDALCASLTRRLPLSSGLSGDSSILNDPQACYVEAARRLMNDLAETQSATLADLLLHLDNHIPQLEKLFTDMLSRRDQWLPHLIHRDLNAFKMALEQALQVTVLEILQNCRRAFPAQLGPELASLLNFATNHLQADKNPKLQRWQLLPDLPPADLSHLISWQAISDFLLTGEDQWRLTIDIRQGFPATEKGHKQRMKTLLDSLAGEEELRQHLSQLKQAPPTAYSAGQWQIIAALAEILPLLAANLHVIFQEQGGVDFLEISLAALQGLGDSDQPSDLALILDYQIRHILVDEFQDTSTTQFRLLEKLTHGWESNDGRSLFLVGDPMQSIYRFREAEVGLFLKAQREGIGHLSLESLQLSANFRSDPRIIQWINQYFPHLFSSSANISSGSVPYHPSFAMQAANPTASINLHPFLDSAEQAQEQKIIAIIQQCLQETPEHTIAVLVRQRSHLQQLIPFLKAANIAFSATEIESIAQQSIVLDLFALTYALLHLGDRLAWLAVLRAPYCGLSLADLHILSQHEQQTSFFSSLLNFQHIDRLSPQGKERLSYLLPIFSASIQQRSRCSLRQWVENTWRLLQGPACLNSSDDQLIADNYFALLEQWNASSDISDFQNNLNKLRISLAAPAQGKVHLMTIHKAKGLEFDCVIIPRLEGRKRNPDAQLLLWLDRPRAEQENDLLLAAIKARSENHDAIYQYLHRLDQEQEQQELVRLLYVAITRSKKNLHLLTSIKTKEQKIIKPASGSFLELLWQSFAQDIEEKLSRQLENPRSETTSLIAKIYQRIALADLAKFSPPTLVQPAKTLLGHNHTAAHTGSIIHRYLQQLGAQGLAHWTTEKIHSQRPEWQIALLQLGVPQSELENSCNLIATALNNCLIDPRAQWIFNPEHREQQQEWPLTWVNQSTITHVVIDRSFVADGIRWIIDFKTSTLSGESLNDFLDQQQLLHQPQLDGYAQAVRNLDARPIRLGLYFPLCGAWREWEFNGE